MNPKLLTVKEFAALVGIGRSRVYELLAAGEIRSVKIGRLRRIPADEPDRFVRKLLAEQSEVAQ